MRLATRCSQPANPAPERTARGFLARVKNVAWKDEDINWLVAVNRNIQDDLKNIETTVFEEQIDFKELFSIFDQDNIANPERAQKEFAEKLKAQTLRDIKNNYYSNFVGLKRLSATRSANRGSALTSMCSRFVVSAKRYKLPPLLPR